MIIPPRDQGVRLSVPPIVAETFKKIVGPVGSVLRENGAWILLFVGLAALLVGVTVTTARHAHRTVRDLPHDLPHASAPNENTIAH
jgi:hypothetical protein